MFHRKLGLGTGIVAALLMVAIEVPASAQSPEPARRSAPNAQAAARTTSPAWLTGLLFRSEALNRKYGLGAYARRPESTSRIAWLVGLYARSDALNRKYGLGEYGVAKG